MYNQEFIDNATNILVNECDLTQEQAQGIANLTVILESNKLVERVL